MAEYKLGEIETIFADIIWDNEPVFLPPFDGTGGGKIELEANHHLHHSEAALRSGAVPERGR